MMLFKLSLKNIKKSFKDYAIYFLTLILGVAIFYTFNAIESQSVLLDVTSSTRDIIKLMTNLLSGVSVFVSFVLGFLIIYANRFLMKRRNKEFGIYLTLGMSKRKISMLLFFETLFIGVISLLIGLGIGVVISQGMSLIVANMFEADMTNFTFIFSSSSCIKTLIYFGIMYLLVMIFNTINVSKCKLIDLLHFDKKSEKVKLKNPILCTLLFILSSIVLGIAYYLVTGGFSNLQTVDQIFIPIIMGSISTFFIFWSLSGLLLKLFMSIKRFYYKGLNSFILRQVSSKINTTVFSMTLICLMLFITICVLSSSLSIKNSMTSNIRTLAPADIEFTKRVAMDNSWLDHGYSMKQIETSKLDIFAIFQKFDLDISSYLKEFVDFYVYQDQNVTMGYTLGSKLDEAMEQYRFLAYESLEDIVKISDYNRLAKFYGNKEYTLNNDEYIILADFDSMVKIRNSSLSNKEELIIFGKKLKPKYLECQDGFIEMSSNHINSGIILVPDDVVMEEGKTFHTVIGNYKMKTKEEKQAFEERINSLKDDSRSEDFLLPSGNSKLSIIEASVGLGALVTFIGLYLGIIFLISSAAILALKELSESTDNKKRFNMLRKIGADERVINRALFRQIAVFFLFPLLLAIIHSIFGILFCNQILETFGSEQLLKSTIMTASFLIIIYGGYFMITYFCSKNIIKEK